MAYYSVETQNIKDIEEVTSIQTTDEVLIAREGSLALTTFNGLASSNKKTTVKVIVPSEGTITLSCGDFSITKVGTEVIFELPFDDTWLITAVNSQGTTARQEITTENAGDYVVELSYVHIYGIRRDQNSSSPEWTRTDDAIGFTATASVGNTIIGSSDFDDAYPWSEMKRVTFGTGDVMVYIPEFYYKRVVDSNGIETIQIADTIAEGFEKHPGSGTYIGAYVFSSGAKSVSGAAIQASTVANTFRTTAKNKGNGWGLMSAMQLSAVQMLYLVEFASYQSQGKLGRGAFGYAVSTCGSCDGVTNLTGRPSGSDTGGLEVIYRGIETVWSNYWKLLDGINIHNNSYYVCENPSNFAFDTSTNYTQLSYSCSLDGFSLYYQYIGYDKNIPWAMFPKSGTNGSGSTYLCDGIWTVTSGWRIIEHGGAYDLGSLPDCAGMFAYTWSEGSSASHAHFSARVAYYPELDPENTAGVSTS